MWDILDGLRGGFAVSCFDVCHEVRQLRVEGDGRVSRVV